MIPVSIAEWWPKLRPETRSWLTANNGDAVPASLVDEIAAAGGPASDDLWWVRDENPDGPVMPDSSVDWIEELANGEEPHA
jgi:hypothetical protein